MTVLVLVLALALAFAGGFRFARRDLERLHPSPLPPLAGTASRIAFASGAGPESDAWQDAMKEIGAKLSAANVRAIVFVHGTFTGTDPLSAIAAFERALPGSARGLARSLRKKTRAWLERILGDVGNFSPAYVRSFERAIANGDRPLIPCTSFLWSSENHHVGRLEGALGLARVLATHADLASDGLLASPRLLVVGHSHAGQVFALLTQLLADTITTEAVLDVARARGLDVNALEHDLVLVRRVHVDFVTFGAPARYAWASLPNVRALHVRSDGDLIHRLAGEGSDFPALDRIDRELNATLRSELGEERFAPSQVLAALTKEPSPPAHGDLVVVDYGKSTIKELFASGLGHGHYTRIDGMLFHATLISERLYSETN